MQFGSEANDERSGLERILAPMSVEQFLADSFGKAPLHLKGEIGRFKDLIDWEGLARLLESHALEPPRLAIVKAGKSISADRYLRRPGGIARIDGGALSLLLDSGATAIINHVDDLVPAIGALADEAGDRLGARVAVNLYATWRSEHGFDPHWDHHDVFVLQLAGSKQWPIYSPTRSDPLRGDVFEAPPAGQAPECVELLEDGDLLYLPRGWIHAPAPVGEPSLHLTFAITRPTGAGFLDWLAKELQADPEVRAALPLPGHDLPLAKWKERMTAILAGAIEAGAVDRFLVHKDSERGARPRFSFPDFGRTPVREWNQSTKLRPSSLHRFMVDQGTDGGSKLTAMGRTWPCSNPVGAAFARLKSTRSVTLGALEADLSDGDRAQLRQLLTLLATFGLLSAK